MRSRLVAVALLMTLSALTSCGEDKKDAAEKAEELSKADVEKALLTVENLGPDFVVDEEDDEEDEGSLGCLDSVDDDISDGSDSDADVAFSMDDEVGLPGVFSGVASFGSDDEAKEAFDDFVKALEGCEHVKETDKDGFTLDLEVELDTDKQDDRADQQVSLNASGTAGDEEFEIPFGMAFQFVRLDNDLVAVGFVNMDELGEEAGDLLDAALDRFVAVRDGEELPEAEPVLDEFKPQTAGA